MDRLKDDGTAGHDLAEVLPLISVIVPIYNVERYVRKCLDSLKGQTLREIEVICIDDGSTDGSGRIADEYASSEFPIFRVIHTENRGLSAARNRGIDEATAPWIMFVDSDDWVSPDFCRIPYEAAIENQADLVIFDSYSFKHGRIKKPRKSEAPVGLIDEFTAHEYGDVVVWNKLYRAFLFDRIRYPEGHVHEDVATTHKVVHLAQNIIRVQNHLYFNQFRRDSICNTHTIANRQDGEMAVFERNVDLLTYGYPEKKQTDLLCSLAIWYLTRHTPCDDDQYKKAADILDSINEIPKRISLKQKIAFLTWKADKRLFYLLCGVAGRMK